MCWVAGHVAEVLLKVVVAGRTGRLYQSLGKAKLGRDGLQLFLAAANVGGSVLMLNISEG